MGLLTDNKNRKGQQPDISLKIEGHAFQTLPRGAEPRAEDARMSGGLVMRVVRRMVQGLDIDCPAEEQQADREADGDRLLKDSTHRDIADNGSGIGNPCQAEKCGGFSYRIPVKIPVYWLMFVENMSLV